MSEILPFPRAERLRGGRDRPAEARRAPDETLYDYMVRIARGNEREIERLNRTIGVLEDGVINTNRVIARRFRQLIYLETVAASIIAGGLMIFGRPSAIAQCAVLVLLPLASVAGGIGFLTHAARIEGFLAKLASWRRRR
ncbi:MULTISPECIES: hypothetical protein [Sphingomonadaceae]|nr:hypothetical protein [Sphingobium sp. TKS]AMK23092.1 hypothetical protein K426_10750 [Sphingobium sp. TKS]MCF8707792.1 hypothetical protein [Rhizorhapis sp. SPR117]